MSDKFRIFAMRFLTSFPPDFAFSRGSGEFLFLLANIRNIYQIDNQSVVFLLSISRLSLRYLREGQCVPTKTPCFFHLNALAFCLKHEDVFLKCLHILHVGKKTIFSSSGTSDLLKTKGLHCCSHLNFLLSNSFPSARGGSM